MPAASSQCQWSRKHFRSNLDQKFYKKMWRTDGSFCSDFFFATTASCAALWVLLLANAQPWFLIFLKIFCTFMNHLTSALCPKSASQCCCKQAPLCPPQIGGQFHVLGASQPLCALGNMASFTARDGDNGVMRHKCHSPDKRVHETCWTGWAQLMQLIKKKVFSQYSACIIKLPAVVFAVECPKTCNTAPQRISPSILAHRTPRATFKRSVGWQFDWFTMCFTSHLPQIIN